MEKCYIIHTNKDVLNIIFNKLPITSQLRLRATCKQFYEKLDITNIPYKFHKILTDKIVLQYPKLHVLDANWNPNITDASVKELKQLRVLGANHNQKITKEGTSHIETVYL